MTTGWKRWVCLTWLLLVPLSGNAATPTVAGSQHTLALRNDGTVFAFGSDSFGQLGQGTLAQSPTPVQVQGLSGVSAISMQRWHALALNADGSVRAWGNNDRGQLGDGTHASANAPVAVRGLTGVTQVAASFNNSVALKADGTVWAWGDGYRGQLGTVCPSSAPCESTVPVLVPGISGVTKVGGGQKFLVALKRDGTVWAWGANDAGQLGDGTTTDRATPAQVSGLTGVTDIAVGLGHIVALKSDGTVWAWGSNVYGQLGDGTTTNRSTPVQVMGLTDVSSIGAGLAHTLAIKTDGTLWAWGWNSNGQLGDGTTIDRPAPARVLGATGVIAVAGGGAHSVGLRSDGTLWAWGANYGGQLGDGTTTSRSSPVQVATTLTEIRSITAGSETTAALKSDGTVWTWGANTYGMLGNDGLDSRSVAAAVPGLGGVVKVAARFVNSLALTSDGTVWAWGSNLIVPIANDTLASSTPVQVAGLRGIVNIALGSVFAVALKSDGTVWAWGWNGSGNLGDGTTTNRTTPVQVVGLSGIRAIAAGDNHALALKSDGTVWAWGQNQSGEVGVTAQTTCNSIIVSDAPCNPVPAQVPTLSNVIAIAGRWNASVALKSDGTVWSWGENNLGNGVANGGSSVPVQAQGLSGVTAISAFDIYTVALKSDGSVWAWGGLNSPWVPSPTLDPSLWAPASSIPVQVQLPGGMIAVGAGQDAGFAVRSDGTLWSWGANTYGNLGDGSYSPRAPPILVSNAAIDGALDLIPEAPNNIPPDRIPPFFVVTYKSGGLSATSLSVDVRGITPSGVFASASGIGPLAAGSYNVYVAAAVPYSGSVAYYQLDSGNRWSALTWPMADFMRGVALGSQDAMVRVNILQNADLSPYIGTSILVGYGTDPDEMVANGRYRTIFTVSQQ